MKKIFIILSFLITILLSACTDFFISEVNQKNLPDLNPKLVVYCVLNPNDSLVQVQVSKSKPVFEYNQNSNDNVIVQNAQVIISDGAHYHEIPFDTLYNSYVMNNNLFLNGGLTYKLTVKAPGFDEVEAFTQIPEDTVKVATVDRYKVEKFSSEFEGYRKMLFQCVFTMVNTCNYYCPQLLVPFVDNFGNENLNVLFPNEMKIFDYERNGQTIKKDVFLVFPSSEMPSFIDSTAILTVNCIDEHYYKYSVSKQNYLRNNNSENPFSEPVIVYTNIKNGLGVFGSYRSSNFLIDLKPLLNSTSNK